MKSLVRKFTQVQDATCQKQIAELCEGEIVIHVDYSENFKNKQQNEIKAEYYGQGQFSLFSVVVYIQNGDNAVCKNYALVTPENEATSALDQRTNDFSNLYTHCKVSVTWLYFTVLQSVCFLCALQI